MAPRALLAGDPGRALLLAQALFDGAPLMFNHNRGLWGYSGIALDGEPLIVQSTGVGGPSAAVVLEELGDLGLRRAVRVGTCSALDGRLALGELLVVDGALAGDGTSRALGAGERVVGDAVLTAALEDEVGRRGLVASTDLHYETRSERAAAWIGAGALAVDLQTAAILAVAARRGIAAGAVLAAREAMGVTLDAAGLADAGERLGRAALAALSATGSQAGAPA